MYESFEQMTVWQKAHKLVLQIWEITAAFPTEDLYTITSQVRRSALSVSANIAEGFGRYHSLDKIKFYLNARGSLYETMSHLLTARDIGHFKAESYSKLKEELIDEIMVELNTLMKTLRPKSQPKD